MKTYGPNGQRHNIDRPRKEHIELDRAFWFSWSAMLFDDTVSELLQSTDPNFHFLDSHNNKDINEQGDTENSFSPITMQLEVKPAVHFRLNLNGDDKQWQGWSVEHRSRYSIGYKITTRATQTVVGR